jgi:hypothetical protein
MVARGWCDEVQPPSHGATAPALGTAPDGGRGLRHKGHMEVHMLGGTKII